MTTISFLMYSASPPATGTQRPVHDHLLSHSNRSAGGFLLVSTGVLHLIQVLFLRASSPSGSLGLNIHVLFFKSFSAELQSPWCRNHAAPLPCWPDFSGVCSWMTQSDRAFRHLEPSDMCTWMQRLCQHLRNKNDKEQPIRHKVDLPTTETDTNFIAVHRER